MATNKEMVGMANRTIQTAIKEVFDNRKKLEGFLSLFARLYLYDWRNILLVWKQCPDATTVTSRVAFEQAGEELPENSQKILGLVPRIERIEKGTPVTCSNGDYVFDDCTVECSEEWDNAQILAYADHPKYTAKYDAVVLFDVSEGCPEWKPLSPNAIVNDIKNKTQFSVRFCEAGDFPSEAEGTTRGILDLEGEAFLLLGELPTGSHHAELIRQYIAYKRRKKVLVTAYEEILRKLSEIVVCKAFGCEYKEQWSMTLVKTCREFDFEMRQSLVREMWQLVSDVIDDLAEEENKVLFVNEIALAKNLVHTSDCMKLGIDLHTVAEFVDDEEVRGQIVELMYKLYYTKEDWLDEFVRAIEEGRLYSYPPYCVCYREKEIS